MEYKWKLKDLEKVEHNGYKVFSCFSCGGWSSMWYKNAGYEVIGTCEIDPEMDGVYQANFPTKNLKIFLRVSYLQTYLILIYWIEVHRVAHSL